MRRSVQPIQPCGIVARSPTDDLLGCPASKPRLLGGDLHVLKLAASQKDRLSETVKRNLIQTGAMDDERALHAEATVTAWDKEGVTVSAYAKEVGRSQPTVTKDIHAARVWRMYSTSNTFNPLSEPPSNSVLLEVDAASGHHLRGMGVFGQREQQVLERGIFVAAPARLGERRVKRLFQFAGKRRQFNALLKARGHHGLLGLNVGWRAPGIKQAPMKAGEKGEVPRPPSFLE